MGKPLTMVLQHHEDILSIVRKNLHTWINGLCLEANDASAERRTVIDIKSGNHCSRDPPRPLYRVYGKTKRFCFRLRYSMYVSESILNNENVRSLKVIVFKEFSFPQQGCWKVFWDVTSFRLENTVSKDRNAFNARRKRWLPWPGRKALRSIETSIYIYTYISVGTA